MDKKLIVFAVILASVIQVMDTTIINVALYDIAASLGVTLYESSWALTSYFIGLAILMPATPALSKIYGVRALLLLSVCTFMIFSFLCGIASNIEQLVVFRFLQGFSSAPLMPLGQSIIYSLYENNEKAKGMATWSFGVMLVPVMAPPVGALLTEYSSWRWLFFINVPFCALTLMLLWGLLEDKPAEGGRFDWRSFVCLGLFLLLLQFMLDRGGHLGYDSPFIIYVALGVFFFFISFCFFNENANSNITLLDSTLLKNRVFLYCSLINVLLGSVLYGVLTLIPYYLQLSHGYSPVDASYYIIYRGVGMLLVIKSIPLLLRFVNLSWLVLIGVMITACSLFYLVVIPSNNIGTYFMAPMLLQGIASGLLFSPLSTLLFNSVAESESQMASGMYNFISVIGASVGVSLANSIYSKQTTYAILNYSNNIISNEHATLEQNNAELARFALFTDSLIATFELISLFLVPVFIISVLLVIRSSKARMCK